MLWQRTHKILSSTGYYLRPSRVSDIYKLLYGVTSTDLYADDTAVYDIRSNMQVLERNIQHSLLWLNKWYGENGMVAYTDKNDTNKHVNKNSFTE